MATGYYTHEACQGHEMGEWHPESPARLAAIAEYIHASGLETEMVHREALPAAREDLLRAHPARHLDPFRPKLLSVSHLRQERLQ